jgi:hypothetical protein
MRSDNACRWTHRQLRGLQAERPMRPLLIVVPHELGQYRPKMLLVHNNEVVKTFSAQCPDHSLRDGVGLWRMDGRSNSIDPDAPSTLSKLAAIDGISIAEQMAWFGAPGRRLR